MLWEAFSGIILVLIEKAKDLIYIKEGLAGVFKAFKFRIYPNEKQVSIIDKTIDCARFIYNKMLEDKISYYEKNKATLYVTPAQYKVEYEFLREVDSLALANAQLNLDLAYDFFFKNPKYGYPQFKCKKKSRKSYTTNLVNGNIRLEAGRIKLPKIGYVKIKQHRSIPKAYALKSCTVIKTSTGRFYIAMLYSYELEIKAHPIDTVIGLKVCDTGLITSDNDIFEYPLIVQQTLANYKRQMKILSKMQNGSNNHRRQWGKILKVREKLANQCKDYLHKTTKQIANAYDCVAVEDKESENKNSSFVIPDFYGKFVLLLSYKLEELGKRLLTISNDKLSDQSTAAEIKSVALKIIAV